MEGSIIDFDFDEELKNDEESLMYSQENSMQNIYEKNGRNSISEIHYFDSVNISSSSRNLFKNKKKIEGKEF